MLYGEGRTGEQLSPVAGYRFDLMTEPPPEYPEYNYPNFLAGPDEAEWADFQSRMRVGTTAPDFEALRLTDGGTVRLSDYTGESTVVLEFGSYT